jgi:hypothetical protein
LPWASLPELVATARIAPATAAAEQADEDLDGGLNNHATGVAPKMGIGCNPKKDGTSSIDPYFNRMNRTLLFYLLERIALAALYHPEMMRMDQHQKRYGWELKIYKSQEFW